MVIKLDSDSNPNPLIGYVDFLRLCNVQNPRDFCGFVVNPDGVYVNMHLNEPTLFPREFAVLSWHPTGRYKEPALVLPCIVSEFKNFISEAGLLGCVVEDELSKLDRMQQLRDERQSDPKMIRHSFDKMERTGMKVSSKELANSPLPHTAVFADDQLASLDACRRSSPDRHAANSNPGGVRAGFRKPHKVAPYVPGGLDPYEADKTITVKYVPMDSAPFPQVQGSAKQRRDLLTPSIEKIQRELSDPFDKHEVWSKLSALAKSKVAPMIGVTQEGIQWMNAKDEVQYFSFKALGERLKRSRNCQKK